jgi:hypothetical protein
MIDVKTACLKATEYLVAFYPKAAKVQIEEVELDTSKTYWYITLSYDFDDSGYSMMIAPRKFKQFKIDSSNGEIILMKIREFK